MGTPQRCTGVAGRFDELTTKQEALAKSGTVGEVGQDFWIRREPLQMVSRTSRGLS